MGNKRQGVHMFKQQNQHLYLSYIHVHHTSVADKVYRKQSPWKTNIHQTIMRDKRLLKTKVHGRQTSMGRKEMYTKQKVHQPWCQTIIHGEQTFMENKRPWKILGKETIMCNKWSRTSTKLLWDRQISMEDFGKEPFMGDKRLWQTCVHETIKRDRRTSM